MSDFEEAQVVLINYREFYPKSLNESLTTHISAAPYHPAVIPIHVDDKILHQMNAADYCEIVRRTIRQMRTYENGLYSAILGNKYISVSPLTDINQSQRMHINRRTFYRKLNHAVKIFAKVCPKHELDYLHAKASK